MTTLAPLRSQWTTAESVYHVRLTGNRNSLPSPRKDTRLLGVGSSAMLGWGHSGGLPRGLPPTTTCDPFSPIPPRLHHPSPPRDLPLPSPPPPPHPPAVTRVLP